MLIRIVELYFSPENTMFADEALKNMAPQVRAFTGCTYVEILKDIHHRGHYSTYSHWKSAEHLEQYRESKTFRDFWSVVKPHFAKPARAWSNTLITSES